MSDNDLMNRLGVLLSFSFVSQVFLFTIMFFFVAIHDYGLVEIYNIAVDYESKNLIHVSMVNLIETTIQAMYNVPQYFDYLWLFSFVVMCFMLFMGSYNAKREGYFSLFSIITIGIIFFIFGMTYILQIGVWFENNVAVVLPVNFTQTPYFDFYIRNVGVVNFLILCICIVLNFIDFNNFKYFNRKEQDSVSGGGGEIG